MNFNKLLTVTHLTEPNLTYCIEKIIKTFFLLPHFFSCDHGARLLFYEFLCGFINYSTRTMRKA